MLTHADRSRLLLLPRVALLAFVVTTPLAAAQELFDAPWRTFMTGTPENGRFAVALAAGDLDGDGLADAVVGQNFFHPGLRVIRNLGRAEGSPATFDQDGGTFLPLSRGAWGVALADLTGDGLPDLAVANYGFFGNVTTVSVLHNHGDGSFAAPVSYAVGTHPYHTWTHEQQPPRPDAGRHRPRPVLVPRPPRPLRHGPQRRDHLRDPAALKPAGGGAIWVFAWSHGS